MASLISTSVSDALSFLATARISVSRIGTALLLFFFCFTPILSQVVINEVITDPQQDWSTNGFDGTIGAGTIDSDDDWIELYITANGLDLTGWTIELNDGTDESGTIAAGGAFTFSNYISGTGGTFTDTDAGDYIILGQMTSGAINQSVTVVLRDDVSALVDQVIIASGSGTMFTGNANDATDESVCRIPNGQDTGVDADDFVKTRATLGVTNSPTGNVLINEVVTNPRTDWSTNDFDGTDGGGTISIVDEWIELYIGTAGLNLTKWTLDISDSDGSFSGDLTSTGAFDVVNYIGSGDFTQTVVGDYLILGNPDGGNDMNENVYIQLFDAEGTQIDDVEIGDNEEGDAADDGAPNSNGSTVANESVTRIPHATDTDVDATDFQGVVSTMGTENGISSVFVDAAATDDTGLGSSGDPKQLIQSGIDLALAGGTVTVVSGAYTENLTISKALTLNGANQGVAGNGARGAESSIDAGATSTILTITSNNVTIDGIQIGTNVSTSNATTGISATVTGAITITNNIVYANTTGVLVAGSSTGTVDITDNLVSMLAVEDALDPTDGSLGIVLSTISGDADANLTDNDLANAGTGIATYALTSTTEAVIDGGTFTGCTAGIIPVNFDGVGGFSPSTLTIQNITMSGFVTDADVVNPDTEVGVYIVSAGGTGADDLTVTMDNLDISGVGNGTINGASNNSGIIAGDFPTASNGAGILATVTNCNIHDNSNRGIYARGEDAVINVSQTLINGNGFDPHATGGNYGFSVMSREGATATVSNCFITNPATLSSPEDIPSGYYVSGLHISTSGSLTVSDCNLSDNGNGFIAETTGIDLSGNYFNSTDPTTIAAAVGTNDFTPFLASGTDTDLGTDGFQGDFDALTVTSTGPQTTGDRIQEGHDLVNADGTITITLADYAEALTVSKNVTIAPASGTTIDDVTLNGGNMVVSGSTITIDNSLTMTSGVFDIDQDDGDKSDDPVFILPGTVNGSSYGDATHFEGRIESSVTGATSFTFEVGDDGEYRPATLTPTTTTTFQVAHIEQSTPTGGGATNPDITNLIGDASADPVGTIESVLNGRYWDIDVSAGGPPGVTNVALQISSGDRASDPADLGMTRFDGSDWGVLTLVSSTGSDPYVITASTSSFSEFSIYSIDVIANPLPVALVDFEGTKVDRNIKLTWSTMTEENADYFQIEHSLDGQSFESIGMLNAEGNSNELLDYQFMDENVAPGVHYYRLKMVDFDGTFEYSSTIQVAPDLSDLSVTMYPNPVAHVLQLEGVDVNYVNQLVFYDLQGKIHKTVTAVSSPEIQVSDLSNGQYLIRLEMADGSVYEGKIVKNE